MQLNQPAPDFELPDLQGVPHKLSHSPGKLTLLNFWSAECPHSERTDRSVLDLLQRWEGQVDLLAIAANRNESLEQLAETAQVRGIPRVLLDREHIVADLYEAVTTPHIFLVDSEGILRYRGAVDDVTFRRRQASRLYLQEAIEALLEGRLPEPAETLAYGCAIVREI